MTSDFDALTRAFERIGPREFRAVDHPMLELWRRNSLGQMLARPLGWSMAGRIFRLASYSLDRVGETGWLFWWPATMRPNVAELDLPEPAPISLVAIPSKGTEMIEIRPPKRRLTMAGDHAFAPWGDYPAPIEMAAATAVRASGRSREFRKGEDHIDLAMQVCGLAFLGFVVLTPALCSYWASSAGRPIRASPAPRSSTAGPVGRGLSSEVPSAA